MPRPYARLAALALILFAGTEALRARACGPRPRPGSPTGCNCNPCCCKDKCTCDPCKCGSCPAASAAGAAGSPEWAHLEPPVLAALYTVEALEMALESAGSAVCGVAAACLAEDGDANVVAPPPPCCPPSCPCYPCYPPGYGPFACCPPPCAPGGRGPLPVPEPRPVYQHLPMPAPMPVGCSTALPPPCRQYQVKVRLTGGAAGACSPQLSLPDGGQGFVSLPDPTNPCRSRQLRVGVSGKDANTVCVGLGLARTLESPCGGLTAVGRCVIEKSQTVKLGEKAQVALNDGVNDAEPYSAEVTVREGPCGEDAVLANAMGAPAPLCCPPPPPVVLGGPAPGWAPPCVPYCPPPMPYHGGDVMPMPTTAPQVVPCALTAPPPCGKRVCLIREGGKSRLQMKAEDGTCASCLRLALEAPASGRMRLAAGKKQVHVAGRMWKARADQVELLADGRVILGGKVRVVSDKAGVCAVLKGQRIVLRVQDGRVKDVMGGIFE